jgi:hypothetical protein
LVWQKSRCAFFLPNTTPLECGYAAQINFMSIIPFLYGLSFFID